MSAVDRARPALRGVAFLIAIAAAIDPAVTSTRSSKPLISVVPSDVRHDSAAAERVAHALERSFTVIPAPFPADESVLVGDAPPHDIRELSSPVFAASASAKEPSVMLESIHAPATAPYDARVVVTPVVHVTGARGRTVELTLRSGNLVVDRATRVASTEDARISAPLGFLPPAAGTASLRVDASVSGTAAAAHADAAVNVRDTRWSVLFYDPRPSYMSTFVRRAVERDRRFLVTSRVVTSKNVSTDAGQPPARLDDIDATSHFDALVLGAPEALTASDVSGLEAYLRRRGGSVVLLFDQHVSGAYERLVDAPTWATKSLGAGIAIARAATDSAALRAADVAWPTVLPLGAEIVARALPTSSDSARDHAVIWQTPVGAGRLVVSGALDAWRFRDPTQSDFDRFWQTEIADAASLSPPPLAVNAAATMLAPGEETEVVVTVRRAALAGDLSANPNSRSVAATASASVIASDSAGTERRTRLRLWPAGSVGQFRATFTAPSTAGAYRIVASAEGATAETPVVVGGDATRAHADTRDLFAMWIAARGGRIVSDSDSRALTAGLLGALHPAPRAEIRHPMRSAWWLVPFALALCGEWWLRRRRGLP